MTNLPDDMLDPAEGRLARRIGSYTDQVVFPIDPVSIAASAAVAGRRQTLAGRLFGGSGAAGRLALIGAGAVLAVAGLGVVISGGARGLFAPGPTSPAQAATLRACSPYDVDAVITAWGGAAGHRIATVELRHIGTTACAVAPLPQPWLADGGGSRLIDGQAGGGSPVSFAPGEVLHTLVDVANYCGAAPAAPVTLAFTQKDAATFVATALTPDDLTGVPPCNGPGFPGTIQMHPWSFDPAAP